MTTLTPADAVRQAMCDCPSRANSDIAAFGQAFRHMVLAARRAAAAMAPLAAVLQESERGPTIGRKRRRRRARGRARGQR